MGFGSTVRALAGEDWRGVETDITTMEGKGVAVDGFGYFHKCKTAGW